jgi:hypothetical protein
VWACKRESIWCCGIFDLSAGRLTTPATAIINPQPPPQQEANKYAKETFYKKKDGEKAMFDEMEKERIEKEKAEREAAMAEAEANGEPMVSAEDITIEEIDEDDEDWDDEDEDVEEIVINDEL